MSEFIKRHLTRGIALVLVIGLYWATRLPEISSEERQRLAGEFRFERLALPTASTPPDIRVRQVNSRLRHIAGWISAVGASVALADLDRDGLPNDVCYVDPRGDVVVVAPVPGTPARYPPFELHPAPLPYDSATMAPMGCLPGDFNEDGWMDLAVYFWGRTPIAFLHVGARAQSATSEGLSPEGYRPREVASRIERWYTNAMTVADIDGDGHADLIVGNYDPDDSPKLGEGADVSDVMQHSMSRAFNGGMNRIFLWQGGTSGTDPTVLYEEAVGVFEENVGNGWTLALGAADLDGDFLPELYFANDFGPDRLLHNLSVPGVVRFRSLTGKKTLTTPNSKVLGRDSFKGMGVDFGDLNGDGVFDIYVSNIADQWSLEESHFLFMSTGNSEVMKNGIAPYLDRSESMGLSRSGWGWEARLADFNNDGVLEAVQATGFLKGSAGRWPELQELAFCNDELISNPSVWPRFGPDDDLSGKQHNPFFVRASDGRYYDIAGDIGLAQEYVTRGIATADVDGDGDLDFAIANQWEDSWFFRNESASGNTSLILNLFRALDRGASDLQIMADGLRSPVSGTPAIGAIATIRFPDGTVRLSQVDGGNGHSGARSHQIHLGLGSAPWSGSAGIPVELKWRGSSGTIRTASVRLRPGNHTILFPYE